MLQAPRDTADKHSCGFLGNHLEIPAYCVFCSEKARHALVISQDLPPPPKLIDELLAALFPANLHF